ncbi:unnamed protein product [Rhizophagus irregularis]|uniref:Uncharacterized protein n=1 Tax=Rhizophagus irregularis TaxID=588596 RepID=A0A915ZGP8_9GLOM|nr:unnamed protein product [Rhizophagus irregularis]
MYDSTILSPSSHGNSMDILSMKMGFEDGMSYQDKLPWQNASQLDQQNRDDGSGEVFPHINSNFGGRRGDNMVHVWGINSQWETIGQHIQRPLPNSDEENRNNTGIQMVTSACSDRIRNLSSSLGQLLRVDTLENIAWDKKKLCHLVLPDDQPKIQKNEDNVSMWQVLKSDEKNEIHEYRNNFHIVVKTFMNPNRCYIANSLGYKLHDKDQKNYISYIKEEFTSYIEEVNRCIMVSWELLQRNEKSGKRTCN